MFGPPTATPARTVRAPGPRPGGGEVKEYAMAIVHDVIPPFQLFQPASLGDALDLLDARGSEAWVLAGGMDSMDWLKDRTRRTSAVIELESGGRAARHQ